MVIIQKINFMERIIGGVSLGNTLGMAMLFRYSLGYSRMTQGICLLVLLMSLITTGATMFRTKGGNRALPRQKRAE